MHARDELGAFDWTSIQVNRASRSRPHRDYNAVGPSALLLRGDFAGGGVFLPDSDTTIGSTTEVALFDSRQTHETADFTGDRVSIVAFTHACADEVPDELDAQLATLGFPRPGRRRTSLLDIAIDVATPLPAGAGAGLRFLHLFSGPKDRADGLACCLAQMGAACDEYDIVNGDSGNLADDVIWERLLTDVRAGLYAGKVGGPPCSTFSSARGRGRGPRVVRGATGPDRYGVKDLTPDEKEAVRLGMLLAQRDASINAELECQGRPWVTEQPRRVADRPSMFHLDEFIKLETSPSVQTATFYQCGFGAPTAKPTTVMYGGGLLLPDLPLSCAHEKRDWGVTSTGEQYSAPHPRLAGHEWPVLAGTEASAPPPRGRGWLSASAAAYPGALNRYLALALCAAARAPPSPASSTAAPPPTSHTEQREPDQDSVPTQHGWRWTHSLRPRAADARDEATARALGGMRHPAKAVDRLARARFVGDHVRQLLEGLLLRVPKMLARCISAIGSQDESAGPTTLDLAAARSIVGRYLGAADLQGVHTDLYETPLRAGLLAAWAEKSLDPDLEATSWLSSGAPAGITLMPGDNGIFPTVCTESDLASTAELEKIGVGFDPEVDERFYNYSSVEFAPAAAAEVQRLMDTGFVRTFDSYDACAAWLGARPRPPKLAMLEKEKDGKIKRRLILDCRRGPDGSDEHGVNAAARLAQRIVLPRGQDVAGDYLALAADLGEGEELEGMVLDFTDAFYHVPLAHAERPYFCASYGQKWLVFLTIAQGSKNAPLIWGRLAALIMRFTAALYPKHLLRAQCYVDDPIVVVKGTREARRLRLATIVLLWRTLGMALAFRKGARGRDLSWVGLTFELTPDHLRVSVKPSILEEVKAEVLAMLSENVVATKRLERLAGKASHIAGVVAPVRPFLQDIWGALAAARQGLDATAPRDCTWTRRFRHALAWLRAFLEGDEGTLFIDYPLARPDDRRTSLRIQTDASPWGFAGFLVRDGQIIRWFATDVEPSECELLHQTRGEASGQQTWECLAILVGLRLWFLEWRGLQAHLEVRSDSVAALTLLLRMKSSGVGPGVIARETALLLARVPFVPVVLAHTPGVANVLADALSRLSDPSDKYSVPPILAGVPRDEVPTRDREYFRSLDSPRASGGT